MSWVDVAEVQKMLICGPGRVADGAVDVEVGRRAGVADDRRVSRIQVNA